MLGNVALKVAGEIGCYTTTRSQQLAIFLAGLATGWVWGELEYTWSSSEQKRGVYTCPLVETTLKLKEKLLEGWYTMKWCYQLLQSVEYWELELYFVQRFAQQQKLRDSPCYTVQFSGNLSRNGIAKQVAQKISQCNKALCSRKLKGKPS